MLFERFYPDEYMESTYSIDFEALYQSGYRSVIFDVDNTLVPHGAPADERSIALMQRLKTLGMQVLFLSNNKEPRVKMFRDGVDYGSYIYKAGKPGRAGYVRAMEQLGTSTKDTLFVGDQLFTDVWGAKKAGLFTILVKPMNPKEEIQIVLKRVLEKPILFCYKRSKKRKDAKA